MTLIEKAYNPRFQEGLLWWALAFGTIYLLSWYFLIGMFPLPPATWTSNEIAAFYTENQDRIIVGAVICSWTAGFLLPLTIVTSMQMARLEKGAPVLAILQAFGGCFTSVFIVLPPIFWGICAYAPDRLPDATAALHQTGNLMLVTTTQWFMYSFVPMILICFTSKDFKKSAFPRWYGYFCIFAMLAADMGALGFLTKQGPFAWDGAIVFWVPFVLFFGWISLLCYLLIRAIRTQRAEFEQQTT